MIDPSYPLRLIPRWNHTPCFRLIPHWIRLRLDGERGTLYYARS